MVCGARGSPLGAWCWEVHWASGTARGAGWGRGGGVAAPAGGAGGLREGGDPEGRGRARAAHARCIVLTENAVGFESGGVERVPPADREADPLQVSARAGRGGGWGGAGGGPARPRPAPPRPWAWELPPGAAWGPAPPLFPFPPPPASPLQPPGQPAPPASAPRLDSGLVDHHPTRLPPPELRRRRPGSGVAPGLGGWRTRSGVHAPGLGIGEQRLGSWVGGRRECACSRGLGTAPGLGRRAAIWTPAASSWGQGWYQGLGTRALLESRYRT